MRRKIADLLSLGAPLTRFSNNSFTIGPPPSWRARFGLGLFESLITSSTLRSTTLCWLYVYSIGSSKMFSSCIFDWWFKIRRLFEEIEEFLTGSSQVEMLIIIKWKIKRDESISLRLVVFVNVILGKWQATYEDKTFLIYRKRNCTNATLLEDANKIAYRDEKVWSDEKRWSLLRKLEIQEEDFII